MHPEEAARTLQVRIEDPAAFHPVVDELGSGWNRTIADGVWVAERSTGGVVEMVVVVEAPRHGWMLWWLVEPDTSGTNPLWAMGACLAASTLVLLGTATQGAGGWSAVAGLSTMAVSWAAAVAVMRRRLPDVEAPAAALGRHIVRILEGHEIGHTPSLEPLKSERYEDVRGAGQMGLLMAGQAERALDRPQPSVSLYPTLDAIEDHSRRAALAPESTIWQTLQRLRARADGDERYARFRALRSPP